MSNELKDIAERLSRYLDEGWEITQAAKNEDGSWCLTVQLIEKKPKAETQEATNDNNYRIENAPGLRKLCIKRAPQRTRYTFSNNTPPGRQTDRFIRPTF